MFTCSHNSLSLIRTHNLSAVLQALYCTQYMILAVLSFPLLRKSKSHSSHHKTNHWTRIIRQTHTTIDHYQFRFSCWYFLRIGIGEEHFTSPTMHSLRLSSYCYKWPWITMLHWLWFILLKQCHQIALLHVVGPWIPPLLFILLLFSWLLMRCKERLWNFSALQRVSYTTSYS